MINKLKFGNLTHSLQNAFAITSGKWVMANLRRRFLLLGQYFLSTDVMSIKMCFWVELYMFFVLHDYLDVNIIFFVLRGL